MDLVTLHGIQRTESSRRLWLFRVPGSEDSMFVEGFYERGWEARIRQQKWTAADGTLAVPRDRAVAILDAALARWTSESARILEMARNPKLKGSQNPRYQAYVANMARKLERPSETLREFRNGLVLQGIRKKVAARSIQGAFRNAIANPAYRLCKKRLLREFMELQ